MPWITPLSAEAQVDSGLIPSGARVGSGLIGRVRAASVTRRPGGDVSEEGPTRNTSPAQHPERSEEAGPS